MPIQRERIGPVEQYKGHEIEAQFIGPDFLAIADGAQVGSYWISPEAARAGARRYVDQVEAEKKKRSAA